MAFKFRKLQIPDVILIEPQRFEDERGYFSEIYKQTDFKSSGITCEFKQLNHSRSKKGVLRGLHYQLEPMAQAKLVRVLSGKIFDVAVDIRKGSPTYGKWVGEELDSKTGALLYIPTGFAHGFLTLSEEADVEYLCSEVYAPALDRGIRYDDKSIGVEWPSVKPLLSAKDLAQAGLGIS